MTERSVLDRAHQRLVARMARAAGGLVVVLYAVSQTPRACIPVRDTPTLPSCRSPHCSLAHAPYHFLARSPGTPLASHCRARTGLPLSLSHRLRVLLSCITDAHRLGYMQYMPLVQLCVLIVFMPPLVKHVGMPQRTFLQHCRVPASIASGCERAAVC